MSKIISSREVLTFSEVNFAISEVTKILDIENIRKSQIEKKIQEELQNLYSRDLLKRVDEINFLEENLNLINKNIKSLESFNQTLEKKKFTLG